MLDNCGIQIEIKESKELPPMVPVYDHESNILEVRNPLISQWPYGLDINGNIVFDLDDQKVLANFDLHISMDKWQVVSNINKPLIKSHGKLKFSDNALKIKSFNIPIKLLTNEEKNILLIEFNNYCKNKCGIKLSDNCIAILEEDILMGFYLFNIKR